MSKSFSINPVTVLLLFILCLSPSTEVALGAETETQAALTVILKADKRDYIELEPIRLLAFVERPDAKPLYISHPIGSRAAVFEYFQVSDDGQTVSIGSHNLGASLLCGTPPRPSHLMWSAYSSSPDQFWIGRHHSTGSLKFRVKFTPLHGPLAGTEFVSEDFEITIRKPQGKDGMAYDALTALEAKAENPPYPALVFSSGSPQERLLHAEIIRQWGDSLYSFYVRRMMARYLRSEDEELYQDVLEKTVNHAPKDFPLLAESYSELMEYYKGIRDLTKLSALAQRAQREQVASTQPGASIELNRLVVEAEKLSRDKEYVRKSTLTMKARAAAKRHPLTLALEKVYGKAKLSHSYSGHLVAFDSSYEKRQTWGFEFAPPTQGISTRVKYFVNDTGILEQVEFSGTLAGCAVGPLKDAAGKIMQQYNISHEGAREVFVQGAIEKGFVQWKFSPRMGRTST